MNIKTLLNKIFKSRAEKSDEAFDTIIKDVYKKHHKEIESLRKHDQGEKIINAPDLRQIG